MSNSSDLGLYFWLSGQEESSCQRICEETVGERRELSTKYDHQNCQAETKETATSSCHNGDAYSFLRIFTQDSPYLGRKRISFRNHENE